MVFINNPIRFTLDELGIINENPPTKSSDWRKDIFEDIRHRIRSEMLNEQNYTCPYCNFQMFDASFDVPVEHIVPKSHHLNFMFEPRNLAVSCSTCNNRKSTKETLVDPSILYYPNSGDAFLIIHPYYDDWDDHLELEYNLFIISKNTDKGNNTIKMCKLNRESLYENRARLLVIQDQTGLKKTILELREKGDQRLTDRLMSFLSQDEIGDN